MLKLEQLLRLKREQKRRYKWLAATDVVREYIVGESDARRELKRRGHGRSGRRGPVETLKSEQLPRRAALLVRRERRRVRVERRVYACKYANTNCTSTVSNVALK